MTAKIRLLLAAAAFSVALTPPAEAKKPGPVADLPKVEKDNKDPQKPAATPPDWNRLVTMARDYGMPLPPPTASLALIDTESCTLVGDHSTAGDPEIYTPGWLLEDHGEKGIVALIGMTRKELEVRESRIPLWRPFSLDDPKPKSGGHVVRFGESSVLAVAVQCAARGDRLRAEELWQSYDREEFHDDEIGGLRASAPAHDAVLQFAFQLLDRQELMLAEPGADLTLISQRMSRLLEEYPVLSTRYRQAVLESLQKTLSASAPAPGSVEALLISSSRRPEPTSGSGWDEDSLKIVRMGFDAIPELLRLSSDSRITPRREPGMNNASSRPLLLGDMAQALLGQLLLGKSTAAGRFAAFEPAEDFPAEWQKARKQDEDVYYMGRSFRKDDDGRNVESEAAFAVLTAKYPQRLAEVVDRFKMEAGKEDAPYRLCEAIAGSGLPVERKRELLLDLASDGSISRRRAAVQTLATHGEGPAAIAPARALAGMLPKNVKGELWTAEAASAVHALLEVDDDETWQILFDKARAASVGLRMEWMNPFDYTYLEDRLQDRRLAFLAGFMDDATVRDLSKGGGTTYDGPCAAFQIPRITVGNFAVWQCASILKIDPTHRPDENWEDKDWKALREKVQAGLKERGIQAMKGRGAKPEGARR